MENTKKRNKLDWQGVGIIIALICVVIVAVGITSIPIAGIAMGSVIAGGGWGGIQINIDLIALTLSLCSIFLIGAIILDYKIIKNIFWFKK